MMKRLVDLCHREGMYVVGYYSLIYNTVEEDRHPEWRMVSRDDGTSDRQRGGRYGLCCPSNPEYVAFVLAQIAEIADYFDLDVMFYDMTFWPGGDLYGDLYNHSFTAKYYYNITKNQPFEYMTVRWDRTLQVHTNSKTVEHLAVEVMLTAAHHGASFIIDGIDPVGPLDPRVYDRIGRDFERQIPYEPYFRGEMVREIGVYASNLGRYNTREQKFDNKTCSVALTRTLIEDNFAVGMAPIPRCHSPMKMGVPSSPLRIC